MAVNQGFYLQTLYSNTLYVPMLQLLNDSGGFEKAPAIILVKWIDGIKKGQNTHSIRISYPVHYLFKHTLN